MSIYPIKLYLKNVAILITAILGLLVNISIWIWLLWQISPTSEPIFLHYNILFGVDYIGEWWRVLYLPLIGFIIWLINNILGWVLYGRDKFLAQLLSGASLFCQIFLLIAACLLVFLNV